MPSPSAVPLIVSVLVPAMLGLAFWGFWRYRSYQNDDVLMGVYDQMLVGLLILSAFALKAFLAYLLLCFDP
jgi:hypothetical protein